MNLICYFFGHRFMPTLQKAWIYDGHHNVKEIVKLISDPNAKSGQVFMITEER